MNITRPKSLKALVVEEVRRRIIDGRMRLGAGLTEQALAADLGISKTPVREALMQLKVEGLVEVLPQRGTYVFRLAANHVEMISELREILELAAMAAAIERNHDALVARMTRILDDMQAAYDADDTLAYHALDGEYHQAIIDLSGNPYINDAYSLISFRFQALRSRLSDEADLNRLSFRDHREMLRLIKAREMAGLRTLLRAHIDQTKRSYLRLLERQDHLSDEKR